MNLLFHASGKKRPKLKDESGDETTLIETAHSAGSPVSFAGNAGLGWLREPLVGTALAKLTVAFEGRIALKEEAMHSNACMDTGLRPKIKDRIDWARMVKFAARRGNAMSPQRKIVCFICTLTCYSSRKLISGQCIGRGCDPNLVCGAKLGIFAQ
jgi:hypothetical protein